MREKRCILDTIIAEPRHSSVNPGWHGSTRSPVMLRKHGLDEVVARAAIEMHIPVDTVHRGFEVDDHFFRQMPRHTVSSRPRPLPCHKHQSTCQYRQVLRAIHKKRPPIRRHVIHEVAVYCRLRPDTKMGKRFCAHLRFCLSM